MAVAVLATAGCAGEAGTASPQPQATTTVDSGFGRGPEPSPAPTAGGEGAGETSRPAPRSTRTKPAAVPKWADVVRPCPNKGQKVEIQQMLEADVTGDGRAETIIARTCEASTSYWPSTIEVFDGATDPSHPKRIGKPLLKERHVEDAPVVTQLSVNADIIGVKAYGTSPKSSLACPDLKLFYRYEYRDGGFRLIWRDWGPGQTCD